MKNIQRLAIGGLIGLSTLTGGFIGLNCGNEETESCNAEYVDHREALELYGEDSPEAKLIFEREKKFSDSELNQKIAEIFENCSNYDIKLSDTSFEDVYSSRDDHRVSTLKTNDKKLKVILNDRYRQIYTVEFNGETVAEFENYRGKIAYIHRYIPGNWENTLDNLYHESLAREIKKEEADTQKRIGNLRAKIHGDLNTVEKSN